MTTGRALAVPIVCSVVAWGSSSAAQWPAPPTQPQAPAGAAAPGSQPPGAPAQPYDPSMQAGGLAPPPPMQPVETEPPPDSTTTHELDDAKEKDSGRGLEFVWLNVEGGFAHIGLSTFNVDEPSLTAGFIPTSASGGTVGA